MKRSDTAKPLTVTEVNREARALLESGLAKLWIEGEISGLSRPASGHLYFRLKDAKSQLSAAFFRQRQRGPTIALKNGDQVLAYGRVSIYEARGDFQLIVEQIEPAGVGVLKREYEKLRLKLSEEGLFDEAKKRSLPLLPTRIGVITSPSGAAIRDILSVLGRRFPQIPVVIYPTSVQGETAAGEIRTALETANVRAECDVLILTRGGGSLEDLWAFNDEALARAIAGSAIPTISAVGHEIDFTIADFVADLRAPTPSGAAELVVPDHADWLKRLGMLASRAATSQRRLLEARSQSVDWLQRRLFHASPARRVERQSLMLRSSQQRLVAAARAALQNRGTELRDLADRLRQQSPGLRLERLSSHRRSLTARLTSASKTLVSDRQHRLALASRALNSVSPLATLARGYSILTGDDGKAITEAASLSKGDVLNARLARGRITATVTGTDNSER